MAIPAQTRIVIRQTTALIKKTYLLLRRKWFSTLIRCLLVPVGVMIFLSYAKYLFFPPQTFGFGDVLPIRNLKDAIDSSGGKLVFVRAGNATDIYINRVIENEGLTGTIAVDSMEEITSLCLMNLLGSSNCYAVVVFNKWTEWSDRIQVDYTIFVNPSLRIGMIDIAHSNSPIQSHILPLQWAVDKAIAPDQLPDVPPREWGYTRTTQMQQDTFINQSYMRGVARYMYPAFFIAMIGILYHLPGLFVSEREIGITSLLTAHGCSQIARYLSWHISLSVLYLPGWLIGSIFFAVKLFHSSNAAIIIGFQILGGLSMASFAMFISAFFQRAQLASVFAVTLSMLLATVPVVLTFGRGWTASNPTIFVGLSAVFPPVNYISFLSCFAGWEAGSTTINLLKNINQVVHNSDWPIGGPAATKGIVYWAFSLVHIIIFPLLAALVESWLFSVKTKGRRVALETQKVGDGAPLGIRLTNFSRWYGKVKAVEDLSLKVYQGQIMCLLGANGSGKTTTLQAIAGIGGITGGEVAIAGLNGDGNSTLSGVGVCPQGNVLWDSLTVEEHVKLWAKIKCAGNEHFDDGKIISECDLWKKRSARSSTLSGGMKRKLQLAIMLVGGSTVCCLDEATSGLDPLSRLKIHEIILANRGKRTILFTTHFLDEADVLSDYIAIISKGRVQATGTSAALKTRYGNGYKITTIFPKSELVVTNSAEVTSTLRNLEASGVQDYQVEGPTLESVFLNTVADANFAETSLEKNIDGSSSANVSILSTISDPKSDAEPLDLSPSTVSNFWRELRAIYAKRWMIIRRSYIPVLAAIVIPVAVAIATRGLTRGYTIDRCIRRDSSLRKRQSSPPAQGQFLQMYLNSSILLAPTNFWSTQKLGALQSAMGKYIPYPVPKQTEPDLGAFEIQLENDYANIPIALYYNQIDGANDILGINMEVPLWYSALPLNFMNQLRINESGTNITINANVQMFSRKDFTPPGLGWALIFIFFFGFAMALAASFPTLYPTRERVSKVRALHYSNGVRPAPLWLGHLLYESASLIIAGIICAIIFTTNDPDNWYHPLFLLLIFTLYGITATLLSFVVSLFAKSSLAAFPAMAGINAGMHATAVVIWMVLFTVGSAEKLLSSMNGSFYALGMLFPIANLARALFISLNLFSVACNPSTASTRGFAGLRKSPGAFDLYGGPVFYLVIQSCCFYAFLIWWESGRQLPRFLYRKSRSASTTPNILTAHGEEKSLVVDNVSKTFGRYKAVDNVSFTVSRDETFCLLGPNGAGKTTTLTMILGELPPDTGDIFVSGHSISRQRSLARTSLGVCPQFDAIDNLTVAQTLSFYAAVKGVDNVPHNVREIIRAVGLEFFVHRKVEALSGGNRRKLSLGIALMGNPSVMLLDEPSSGMDAAAKRIMWRTLRAVSSGRAIVLTTHSMEESDALASRVGILGGKMLALGTIEELRMQYGEFHHVHLVCESAPHSTREEMQRIERFLEDRFGVQVGRGVLGQLKFRVPVDRWRVKEVFGVLESAREVGAAEFSVAGTSLEDVFLEVGRRYEEGLEHRGEAGV
ncbi:hypothetical protein BDD12DRAFT_736325 [Trichophaea hybrida]|nr:hypothetical protein BDD12DRAFT_736325 [Trichophaea hybrida]